LNDTSPRWKMLARRAIQLSLRAAPRRIYNIIFDEILRADPWGVLAVVGPECHLRAVRVAGSFGIIQSAPTDNIILRRYAETGRWGQRTTELVSEFFKARGGQYVDVGANIGLTTIPIAQDARIDCLAIEPDPTNFENLSVNVAANCPHRNVELRQCAVYVRRERLRFELDAIGNLGDHRLHFTKADGQHGEGRRKIIEVEAAPLDELVRDRAGPLAVKIDTQGAEPYVFNGGHRTLARAELVVAEWAPYWLARLGGNPKDVTDFLRDNFRTISIADGEDGPIPTPEPARIAVTHMLEAAERYHADGTRYFDVIARK
jgi:FkbM family methyltransferase